MLWKGGRGERWKPCSFRTSLGAEAGSTRDGRPLVEEEEEEEEEEEDEDGIFVLFDMHGEANINNKDN